VSIFLQLLISGLALGFVYSLISLGFVIIYRASEIFNFAQGEFLTLGAFSMISFHNLGLPWGIALVCAMVSMGILGAIVERVLLRPLLGRPVFAGIILTILLGFVLRTLVVVFYGADPMGMPSPWERTLSFSLGETSILANSVATIFTSMAVLLFFYLLFRFSKIGIAMRATSSDQETSMALGIPVGKIFATTWFISGAMAALGGIFLGMFPNYVDANMGFLALRAFPAVIVGGLNSPLGAVLASLLLGTSEVLAQAYINPYLGHFGHNFHAVFPYLVMIIFLIFRPYGILGSKEVKRI